MYMYICIYVYMYISVCLFYLRTYIYRMYSIIYSKQIVKENILDEKTLARIVFITGRKDQESMPIFSKTDFSNSEAS